jgi:adenosine deaminase
VTRGGGFGPLADLHRHLDGSLRESTLRELAAELRIEVPERFRFTPGMGLDAALRCFELTLSVLQQPGAVKRVASEICEDAASEGVTTLEIRFAPQLHQGAGLLAIVAAASEGVAGRAGLILCGLWGEPASSIESLVDAASEFKDVVGIDIAGSGAGWERKNYARAFARARDLGLGRTVHAGEGRPVSEIRWAIEQLHAQRIGHGTTLLDDPAVVALVLERGVTVEACPSSNVHTGAIRRVSEHPLPRWLESGVKATVCTDNTLFSDVDSPTEYERVARIPGMDTAAIERLVAHGHAAAFPRRRHGLCPQ